MFKKIKQKEKNKNNSFNLGWIRIIKEIKNNKKDFLTIFIISILTAAGDSGHKLFLGKTIDSLVSGTEKINLLNQSFDAVFLYLALFILSLFIDQYGSAFLWQYYAPLIRFKIFKSYIFEIFSKVITYPVSLFKDQGVGKITYSITNGANVLSGALGDFTSIFIAPFVTIFSLYFLFSISSEAGILSLISAILFILIFIFSKNKLSSLEEKFNNKNKDINHFVTEKINLIFEIKKNNKENSEENKFKRNELKNINKSFYQKNLFDFKINLLRYSLYIITIGGSLFLSIWLYKNGKISVGEVTSINMYVLYLNWNYEWLARTFSDLVKNLTIIGGHWKTFTLYPRKLFSRKSWKRSFGRYWV